MASKIEVTRENQMAYLKAADASNICGSDETLCDAIDAAIEAAEAGTPDAADLFAAFCALLDASGLVVTETVQSRQEKFEEKAYQNYVAKNPGSNRGKTYR